MEFLSAPWWSALLAIILIDLVLAGDNAIVIALAARSQGDHDGVVASEHEVDQDDGEQGRPPRGG